MLLQPNEKIHVIFRRLFSEDVRRHFAGQVIFVTDQAARVQGFVFIFD
ncbi:MAG: hypothetical protein KKB20_11920 [Proteobacteria bacterium]|nr:hypothetical protein [Pseudomonadota bacterium]